MDSEKLLLRTFVVETANKSLQSKETKVSKKREEGSAVSAVLQMENGTSLDSEKYGGRS